MIYWSTYIFYHHYIWNWDEEKQKYLMRNIKIILFLENQKLFLSFTFFFLNQFFLYRSKIFLVSWKQSRLWGGYSYLDVWVWSNAYILVLGSFRPNFPHTFLLRPPAAAAVYISLSGSVQEAYSSFDFDNLWQIFQLKFLFISPCHEKLSLYYLYHACRITSLAKCLLVSQVLFVFFQILNYYFKALYFTFRRPIIIIRTSLSSIIL